MGWIAEGQSRAKRAAAQQAAPTPETALSDAECDAIVQKWWDASRDGYSSLTRDVERAVLAKLRGGA